jgi:HAD superfamily hydrolase (TIGR01490 family)
MSVAFFDLDKTICSVPTEQQLIKHLWNHGLFSLIDIVAVLWGFVLYNFHLIPDYDSFRKRLVHSTMAKLKVKEFNVMMDFAFENDLRSKIFPSILAEIKEHQKQNRKIVIISTAIHHIVELFAKEVDADHHFSTRLEIADDEFTGKVIGDVHYGKKKKEALLQYCHLHNIDPSVCYAYGDYFEDRLMMEAVGYPVAINPDKKLLKVATERNWKIIDAFMPDVN